MPDGYQGVVSLGTETSRTPVNAKVIFGNVPTETEIVAAVVARVGPTINVAYSNYQTTAAMLLAARNAAQVTADEIAEFRASGVGNARGTIELAPHPSIDDTFNLVVRKNSINNSSSPAQVTISVLAALDTEDMNTRVLNDAIAFVRTELPIPIDYDDYNNSNVLRAQAVANAVKNGTDGILDDDPRFTNQQITVTGTTSNGTGGVTLVFTVGTTNSVSRTITDMTWKFSDESVLAEAKTFANTGIDGSLKIPFGVYKDTDAVEAAIEKAVRDILDTHTVLNFNIEIDAEYDDDNKPAVTASGAFEVTLSIDNDDVEDRTLTAFAVALEESALIDRRNIAFNYLLGEFPLEVPYEVYKNANPVSVRDALLDALGIGPGENSLLFNPFAGIIIAVEPRDQQGRFRFSIRYSGTETLTDFVVFAPDAQDTVNAAEDAIRGYLDAGGILELPFKFYADQHAVVPELKKAIEAILARPEFDFSGTATVGVDVAWATRFKRRFGWCYESRENP
jgi:hypothetical protein